MQTENKILKLDGGVGSWCSEKGVLVATPSLAIGLAARFNLDLRTKELDSESRLKSVGIDELAGVVSWYIAVDSDFNQATAPVLLNTSPDVTVSATDDGRTILSFIAPNTYVSALIAAAKSSQSVTLTVEMGGYDGSGKLIFLLQFPLVMRNRVWTEGGSAPEVPQDPEYLTSAQVKALIAEATRSETPGPAGTTPHIGENGNWFIGTADTGIRAAGKDGKDGTDAEDGEDGKNAYQLAVDNGYSGSVTEWLAELKGEPGAGLHIDATGEPAELHAYDNEKAGFVFACSEIDAKAKTCTKYFYVKKSDDVGDWFDPPLTEVTYERTAEVATLEPVEFSAPAGAADYQQSFCSEAENGQENSTPKLIAKNISPFCCRVWHNSALPQPSADWKRLQKIRTIPILKIQSAWPRTGAVSIRFRKFRTRHLFPATHREYSPPDAVFQLRDMPVHVPSLFHIM